MDRTPLRTIIARILSIQRGIGIEYKFDNAWGVINAIQCDQGARLRWHTLYLIALRAYLARYSRARKINIDNRSGW